MTITAHIKRGDMWHQLREPQLIEDVVEVVVLLYLLAEVAFYSTPRLLPVSVSAKEEEEETWMYICMLYVKF